MIDSPVLLLFDIDGTLISTGRTPRRAFIEVVERITGIRTSLDLSQVTGRTDPQIIEGMLERIGIIGAEAEEKIAEFFPLYFNLMRELYPAANDKLAYPEVIELLEKLSSDERVHLALVTGNMEESARMKLGAFGLNDYFPLGAYGSDSQERSDLPPIAIERAVRKWNVEFPPENVLVIGDTIYDITCALENGLTAVGIARREGAHEVLTSAGAHFVFSDLPDATTLLGLMA